MPTVLQPGFLLVHKSPGETSFEKVRAIANAQPEGKSRLQVSHAGALDPFAQGLLILLVGSATRLMDALHVAPKRYVAQIQWGAETDTGDAGGEVVMRGDPAALTPERLSEALEAFVGWHDQEPPPTSNKRIEGERAYEKAHRGEDVELAASRVYLHEARWRSHALPGSSTLELVCGGGFYVRALARDLGQALGVGAHLSALNRTQIGPWRDPSADPEPVTGRALLPWLSARDVTDFEAGALRQGGTIRVGTLQEAPAPLPEGFSEGTLPIRAYQKDRLIALLTPKGDRLAQTVWLRGL